ncbi:RNA helicase CrhR [Tepidimonas alkaliphilus]|uniref:RNA helicase CrhR n=1 Tax=Tepidimonas alkaliphilus TaxID=2588942 RepID=A0A554WBN4_9BURK|nr:RNA helicase CrhR [Tepidimonas alkaliphilus]
MSAHAIDAGAQDVVARAEAWLRAQGWAPFDFQRAAWRAIAAGQSGLLHASTGAGKTYAVWLGLLARHGAAPPPVASGPRLLWITPLRALAADTAQALQAPLAMLAPGWRLAVRTGDTPTAERARQQRRSPEALVTTPESLSLLLAHADARQRLAGVQAVVVDEWHELLGGKRGVQVQLALARLRRWQPALQVWGLSATLANLEEALAALVGQAQAASAALLRAALPKTLVVDALLPPAVERFAWAGRLGAAMAPLVAAELDGCGSALVFTNTRAQTEWWYQALLELRPHWAGSLALHHGSLDAGVRRWVEEGLKRGAVRVVVCTSSLDLGVDFAPVQRVLQIGSPKGVARLLQRAGRSGHAPGRPSRLTLVPTHGLELVEAAAARHAAAAGQVEPRRPPQAPLDVLVQHLVTVALGGGFEPDDLLAEVRSTHAYAALSDDDWRWCLDFVRRGGPSLQAYPQYRRVEPDAHGVWRVPDARLARRHRLSIGTIVGDAQLEVRFLNGRRLGHVEEGFVARLRPGDVFTLAGRTLELVRLRDLVAWVRPAAASRAAIPRWQGGRLPLSTLLADAVLERLHACAQGRADDDPELRAAQPLLALQARWSALPQPGRLVAEALRDRDGHHLFLYPLAGRDVHLALGGWLAWQLTQRQPCTVALAVNDWGLELLVSQPVDWAAWLPPALEPPPPAALAAQLLASLNAAELAQRRFREIARVAGLLEPDAPGQRRRARDLQVSASLLWQVFTRHDPDNRLLRQARDEVLAQELALDALHACLQRLRGWRLQLRPIARPTPLAFPLVVERLRERLSSETLAARLQRLVAQLERAADAEARPRRRARSGAPEGRGG